MVQLSRGCVIKHIMVRVRRKTFIGNSATCGTFSEVLDRPNTSLYVPQVASTLISDKLILYYLLEVLIDGVVLK